MTDINKLCDELEKLYQEPASYAQLRNELVRAAQSLIDAARESVKLREELEIERMRLAACGVAALGYFTGCAEEYKSASLTDVLRLRERIKELEQEQNIETGWLIEMTGVPGTGNYWKGFSKYSGWGEINEAVRFCRKQDAESVIKDINRHIPEGLNVIPTEHIWMCRN